MFVTFRVMGESCFRFEKSPFNTCSRSADRREGRRPGGRAGAWPPVARPARIGAAFPLFAVSVLLVCVQRGSLQQLLLFRVDSQDDFDVDRFVSDCRRHVQLEELREDLELYYRLLKTAMVELINKDYADFVNLSTNLVTAPQRRCPACRALGKPPETWRGCQPRFPPGEVDRLGTRVHSFRTVPALFLNHSLRNSAQQRAVSWGGGFRQSLGGLRDLPPVQPSGGRAPGTSRPVSGPVSWLMSGAVLLCVRLGFMEL